MKRFIYPFIISGLLFGLGACSEDDDVKEQPVEDIPEVVDIPTEDQLKETCKLPVVVIGSGFSEVGEAFNRRIGNRQTELSEDAKIIFFKGEDIYNFTVEQCKAIGNAYKNGAILAIDQPKEKQILDLAVKITAPEFGEGFSKEEHDVPFADLLAYNTPRGKQYILHDIIDDDPVTYQRMESETEGNSETNTVTTDKEEPETKTVTLEDVELTPYVAGLYADEFCKWLNDMDEAESRSLDRLKATRNSTLDQLVDAQQVTRTYSLVPWGYDDFPNTKKDIANHSVPITVNYFVYGVYSYSKDADYYMVDQEISVCNSSVWRGTGNSEKAFVLTEVCFDAHLATDNGTGLSRADGCNILNHSPNTTTGSQTITTTSSFSLSGNVGLSPSGPSGTIGGGISWGVNHASSLPDVSVANNVMDNASYQNNANWVYSVQYNDPYFPGVFKSARFGDTPEVAKSTFHTYNTWIWQVDKPKKFNSSFHLHVDSFKVRYRAERFTTNNAFKYKTHILDIWMTYYDDFKMVAPKRN